MRARPSGESGMASSAAAVVGMPSTGAGRQRPQPAAAQHECGARLQGRHEPRAEAEFAAQIDRGRLGCQQAVGAAVEDEAVRPVGADDAARAPPAFPAPRG